MNLTVKLYRSDDAAGNIRDAVIEIQDLIDDGWLITIYRLRRKRGSDNHAPAYRVKRHSKRCCTSEHAASQYAQQLAYQFGWNNWPSFFVDQAQRDAYLPSLYPVLPLSEGTSVSFPDRDLLIRDFPKADECWIEINHERGGRCDNYRT